MAEIGLGATFSYETTPGGGSYTALGDVFSITPPDIKVDTTDITDYSHTDGFRRHLATMLDGGEGTVEFYYDPESAVPAAVKALATTKTARLYKIVFAGGGNKIFSGIVTGISWTTPLDDVCTCALTIKQTGTSTDAVS
jgi:hypothetical protein